MYKTFELLKKATYIIVFWSGIFYVLEVRKHGVGFWGVAIETFFGWMVFISIVILFAMFVASSHRSSKNFTKNKITKNVIEDGMLFTVGGHIKHLPVLPDGYLVQSEVLNTYEQNNPNIEISKREHIQSTSRRIKEILDNPEMAIINLSEESLFKENEGDSELDTAGNVASPSNQSGEDIKKEANTGFHAVNGEYTNDHQSRKIDKGLLAYKYHFNLLLSHVLNYELYALQDDISQGVLVISKKELLAKKSAIKEKAELNKAAIEQSLSKLLESVPKFKYKGIVTTTPEIKSRRELNVQDYQLIIFTVLFPYMDWLTFRSCAALNALDPDVKSNLSNSELKKLDQSELGLSLRDKRVLWNARRMYDIYLNRDRDVALKGKSIFNMPVSFDDRGKMYNPIEETVALCEALRFSQTVRQVKPPVVQNGKKAPIYTENDIIRLVYTIFSEKSRFNSAIGHERIGIIKNDLIYIDFDSFIPKFNGRFKEKYPQLGNHLEYQKAIRVFYEKAKSLGLLAMRTREESLDNAVETFSQKTNGELLNVFWEFKEKNTITIENTLILHASQMFKDLLSDYQDYSANPKILGVSKTKAVPLTDYAIKIQPLIEEAEREKRRIKDVVQNAKNINSTAAVSQIDVINSLNGELANQQAELSSKSKKTNPVAAPVATPQPQSLSPTNTDDIDYESISTSLPVVAAEPPQVVTDPLHGLDVDDLGLLDLIMESSVSATAKDLGAANKALENQIDGDAQDAFTYLNREVQVVSLRMADPKHRSVNGGHRYAINEFHKNKLQLIQCSRDAINDASLNLDFTILRVLDAAKANNYRAKNISHTTKNDNILISKAKIFTLFNVIEQMALYQKKGNGSFWSIKQENCKGNKSNAAFNQISVIECVTIDQSKEEAIYQKIRESMWDADKANRLFSEIINRLNDMDAVTHKKLNIIKDPQSDLYLIPKHHLGKLRRTSVSVNSFLAYCEQFKNDLPTELVPFAEKLSAIQLDGKNIIKFEKL